MRIGGFQKNSLIDFPGEMACLVFTPGCNLVCPYCHNPDLAAGQIPGDFTLDQDGILAFLEQRKGFLEGVAITGGEPTLQPDLPDFIQRVRGLGYKVKLDSNGSRPDILEKLIREGLVDYIAMDIKTRFSGYPELSKAGVDPMAFERSAELLMAHAPDYEFRTTCVRPFITRQIMAEIAHDLAGAKRYVLQKCSREVDVLTPGFMEDATRFFTPEEMDGLKDIAQERMENVILR